VALHCCCGRCSTSPAKKTSFGTPEQVSALLGAGTHGVFLHFSNVKRDELRGCEIFALPGGGLEVGVSGFLLFSEDSPVTQAKAAKALDKLGIDHSVAHHVPITDANRASIYETRARKGEIVEGCELTMIIGCGGSVNVQTGLITPGTMGKTKTQAACCAVM
jgi:hypothetical protein